MSSRELRHYCTLFDVNYLLKGLALYRSLMAHETEFQLHVLCMDEATHDYLNGMALPNVLLIRRVDFEGPELLAVKPGRSTAEYCWTCTASLMSYVLRTRPEIDLITYLDSDMYFFASPDPVFDELGQASTLLIEHRFSPALQHLVENGRFNVGWMTFRRDSDGLAALEWWRDSCIEWCFARVEDGRMGDQKYLDSFEAKFGGVHVLEHKGANVAPWNFAGYRIAERGGQIMIEEDPLIFYHFHSFKARVDGSFDPIGQAYLTEAPMPKLIYLPYQAAIHAALAEMRRIEPGFVAGLDPVVTAQPAAALQPPVMSAQSGTGMLKRFAYALLPQTLRQRLARVMARGS
jgi:hypothetical protein